MSFRIRRILVAIRDEQRVSRAQLKKAAAIARANGARIELYHAINEPVALDSLRRGAVAGQPVREIIEAVAKRSEKRLARLASLKDFKGLKVTSAAVWDFPPHEAVIRRALSTSADLVVAAAQPKGIGNRLLLANTDWELIRHCPAPLLILKSAKPYDRPGILVSVDPFHEHAKPAALDPLLLRSALEWARSLKGEVHAFHAHMPLAVKAAAAAALTPIAAWLPPEAEVTHTRVVRGELDRLAERAGIPDARVHLRLGDALTELERIVKQLKPALVVMGAVSRSGLKRVFIGSTAEKAIDRVSCDVLIVKPKGFRTSVPARMPLSFTGQSKRIAPKD
jgi:universal stress protein E